MHTDDEKKQDEQEEAPAEATREASADELDVDSLDLSVETVEERISPSETNVFDK